LDDVGEVDEAAQSSPDFLDALSECENHVQHAVPAQAAHGALCPIANRSEGAFG